MKVAHSALLPETKILWEVISMNNSFKLGVHRLCVSFKKSFCITHDRVCHIKGLPLRNVLTKAI